MKKDKRKKNETNGRDPVNWNRKYFSFSIYTNNEEDLV